MDKYDGVEEREGREECNNNEIPHHCQLLFNFYLTVLICPCEVASVGERIVQTHGLSLVL